MSAHSQSKPESTALALVSPHSPAECAARLAPLIDHEGTVGLALKGMFGSKPVIGEATASSLRLRKRLGYRNSFQTHLTATLQPTGTGTLITGEFGMHPLVKGFMTVGLGVLAIAAVPFAIYSGVSFLRSPGDDATKHLFGVLVPVAMLAFGFGLVRFGRYLARNEARFLTDFLIQALEARNPKHEP